MALAGIPPRWRDALLLVKPETVLRWHRQGFRMFWKEHSRAAGARKAHVSWELLMRRMLGIEVLPCVQCLTTMRAIAVITKAEVIDRILSHVKLAAGPQLTADGYSLQYDVTGGPIPRWATGVDPEPEERGPPRDDDGVDPPAEDE